MMPARTERLVGFGRTSYENVIKPCRAPGCRYHVNRVASRQTAPSPQTPTPAQGPVMAKLAELERTSSNCTDGCQTSFKYGNQPWNGCSSTGDTFSPTCRNARNFKTYSECTEHGLFIGWHRAAVWGYCTSLLAGGKLAGEKRQVAEL